MSHDSSSDSSTGGLDNKEKLKLLNKALPTVHQIQTHMFLEEHDHVQEVVDADNELVEEEAEAEEKGEEEHVPEPAKPAEEAAAASDGDEEELLLVDEVVIEEVVEEEKESSKEDEDEDEDEEDDGAKKEDDDMMMMGFVEEKRPKIISYIESKSEIEEKVEEVDILDPSPIISKIIDYAVKAVELADRVTFLRKTLDRKKLIAELATEYGYISTEQRKQFLLNRKVVDFYRKKKGGRALSDDNPNIIHKLIKKFRVNLKLLDNIKICVKRLDQELSNKIENASENEFFLDASCKKATAKLEEIIRTNGAKCFSKISGNFLSERMIEHIIRKMNKIREEMSNFRLEVIDIQHNLASLYNKLEKIDDLGNGFKMMEFEQIDTEVKNIGEKLEERLNDINKYRRPYIATVHVIAHVMEKKDHLMSQVKRTEAEYDELRKLYRKERTFIQDLKNNRDKYRQEYEELSFSSGLLDKPKLLQDYDLTHEKVLKTQREIESTKAENKQMLGQLLQLEAEINRKHKKNIFNARY